jgi:hypothetical protein
MTSIASQVVLHPKVTQAMAVLATTMGRDKVCTSVPTSTTGR